MQTAADNLCAIALGLGLPAIALVLIEALPRMVEPSSSAAIGQEQTP